MVDKFLLTNKKFNCKDALCKANKCLTTNKLLYYISYAPEKIFKTKINF